MCNNLHSCKQSHLPPADNCPHCLSLTMSSALFFVALLAFSLTMHNYTTVCGRLLKKKEVLKGHPIYCLWCDKTDSWMVCLSFSCVENNNYSIVQSGKDFNLCWKCNCLFVLGQPCLLITCFDVHFNILPATGLYDISKFVWLIDFESNAFASSANSLFVSLYLSQLNPVWMILCPARPLHGTEEDRAVPRLLSSLALQWRIGEVWEVRLWRMQAEP